MPERSFAAALLAVAMVGGGAWLSGCGDEAEATTTAPPPPVIVAPAGTSLFAETVHTTAELSAARLAQLRAETAGRLVSFAVAEGARVEAGDVIARLDVGRGRDAVASARAAILQAEAQRDRAERELARLEPLGESGSVAPRMIDEARDSVRLAEAGLASARAQIGAARRGVREAVLRAPFDGVVAQHLAELGEYLGPGSPIAIVLDDQYFEAQLLLRPEDALALGPASAITLRIGDGAPLSASLIRVGEIADLRSRRLPVHVRIDAPEGRLRAGMMGRFAITVNEPRRSVAVRAEAVFERYGATFVYVIDDENVAHRREVELGGRTLEEVEIARGLSEGEPYLADGIGRVVDGEPVRPQAREDADDEAEPSDDTSAEAP